MILCIDFDGTIHDAAHPVPGRKMGPPMPGAVDAMQSLHRAGHKLIISTANHLAARDDHVSKWCRFYFVPFDSITNYKPTADVYLDDKGLRFHDWDQALHDLKKLGAQGARHDV